MTHPLVVSDTSPIRALNHLERLDLLSRMYDTVLIPPAVRDELVKPRLRYPPIDITIIPRAVVQAPADTEQVRQLQRQLQTGEAQAIVLAEEIGSPLLIDERAGRRIARQRGVPITGVVGLLIEARRRGFTPAVIPSLQRLRLELGFYLSDGLIRVARDICGE